MLSHGLLCSVTVYSLRVNTGGIGSWSTHSERTLAGLGNGLLTREEQWRVWVMVYSLEENTGGLSLTGPTMTDPTMLTVLVPSDTVMVSGYCVVPDS